MRYTLLGVPEANLIAIEVAPTGGNIVPGTAASVPLHVTAWYSDRPGTPVDVTSDATFTSDAPSLVSIAGATATSPSNTPGTATVSVAVGTESASIKIRVWDPAIYASITSLEVQLGGGWSTFGRNDGECFPVGLIAHSPSGSLDVSETARWQTSAARAGRVIDQNLFVLMGLPIDDPGASGYVNLVGSLVEGSALQATAQTYMGSQGGPYLGTCADPRSPGDVKALLVSREGTRESSISDLEVGEAVRLSAWSFHADHSLRRVSDQTALESCDGGIDVTSGGWVTGRAEGTSALVGTYVGVQGYATVAVVPAQSHAAPTHYFLEPAAVNVAQGMPFHLRALARYADSGDRTFDVSSESTWTTDTPTITGSISDGEGTVGASLGNAEITATWSGLAGSGTVVGRDAPRDVP